MASKSMLPPAERLGFAERSVRCQMLTSAGAHSENVDPLLVIAGVDSDNNAAMESTLQYLLLGSTGAASTVLKPHEANLDDSVILLSERRRTLLNTLVSDAELSALRGNTELVTLADDERTNTEAAELYKILQFIDMVSIHRRLGTPLNLAPGKSPASLVETWPLVQAFALQDIGPGGFFTQRLAVSDVGPALSRTLSHVDAVALRRLVRPEGPAALISRHWRAFEALVHTIRNTGRRDTVLTCEAVAEPLVSFSEFARMQQDKDDGGSPRGAQADTAAQQDKDGHPVMERGARLLVGRFSARDSVDPVAAFQECSSLALAKTGGPGLPAIHAIAEAEHPTAGLRAARTIFLAGARTGGPKLSSAVHVLTTAYEAVVSAVQAAVPKAAAALASAGSDGQAARQAAQAVMDTALSSTTLGPYRSSIVAGVQLLSSDGRTVCTRVVTGSGATAPIGDGGTTGQAGFRPRRLAYIRLSVGDLAVDGEPLGSVAYGDTLIAVGARAGAQGAGVAGQAEDFEPSPQPFARSDAGVVILPSTAVSAQRLASPPSSSPSEPACVWARVLTVGLPSTLQWAAGGAEGRACQELTDALARLAESSGRAGPGAGKDEPSFTVGRYGRGVGSRAAAMDGAETGDGTASAATHPTAKLVVPAGPGLAGSLGRPLFGSTAGVPASCPVTLLTGGSLRPVSQGTLHVYQGGVVVQLPGEGPLALTVASHLSSASLVLGSDALHSSAQGCMGLSGHAVVMASGRAAEGIKHGQAGWLDAHAGLVETNTKAAVEAALQPVAGLGLASGRQASTGPATSSSGQSSSSSSLVESALATPRDVLVLGLKPVQSSDNKDSADLALAGRLSTSAALWHGGSVGLVLPHEGDARAVLLDALPAWREAMADARGQDSSEAEGSITKGMDSLPVPLQRGYLTVSSSAGPAAWVSSWEDEHMAEAAVHEDVRGIRRTGTATKAASAGQAKPSVLVTLILGSAGSGALALARGLVEALGGRGPGNLPIVVADSTAIGAQAVEADVNVAANASAAVQAALQTAVSSLSSSSSGSGGTGAKSKAICHVLLVAPPHALPQHLVHMIGKASAGLPVEATVAGSLAVLHARHTYQDARCRRVLPGLLDQCLPGWTGAVVVLAPTDKDPQADRLVATVKSINPHALAVRLPVGLTTFLGQGASLTVPYGTAGQLLSESHGHWAGAKGRAYRHVLGGGSDTNATADDRILHVWAPQEGRQAGGATVEHGELLARPVLEWLPVPAASSCTITLRPALEESRLLECLRALVTLRADRPDLALLEELQGVPGLQLPYTTADGRQGAVYAAAWHASGVVRLVQPRDASSEGGPSSILVALEATPHAIRTHKLPEDEQSTVPHLTITGVGMGLAQVAKGIRHAMLQCRPMLLQPLAERGSGSHLLPRERSSVIRAQSSHPLPSDVTYDGTGYWSMNGDALPEHPLAGIMAKRFLAVHDAAVRVVNDLLSKAKAAAAAEETSMGAQDGTAAQLAWPTEEDQAAAHLTVASLPVGLCLVDLPSFSDTEPLALPLPTATTAPWWEQQSRAMEWLASTLKTVIAE